MMTNEQLAEAVARVKELDAKRAQGEWRYEYRMRKDGMYAGEVFDANGETVATLAWHQVPYDGGIKTDREQNGMYIANAPQMAAIIAKLWDEREDIVKNYVSRLAYNSFVERVQEQDEIIQQQRDAMRMARGALDNGYSRLVQYNCGMTDEGMAMVESIAALDAALKRSK